MGREFQFFKKKRILGIICTTSVHLLNYTFKIINVVNVMNIYFNTIFWKTAAGSNHVTERIHG